VKRLLASQEMRVLAQSKLCRGARAPGHGHRHAAADSVRARAPAWRRRIDYRDVGGPRYPPRLLNTRVTGCPLMYTARAVAGAGQCDADEGGCRRRRSQWQGRGGGRVHGAWRGGERADALKTLQKLRRILPGPRADSAHARAW